MLISADQIVSDLRVRFRDTATENERWTDAEIQEAVQVAVGFWHMRVGFYPTDRTVISPVTQTYDGFTFQTPPVFSGITLAEDVTADDDETWVVTGLQPGACGHLKFGSEYVQFVDVDYDGTLLGVTRLGTAATHSANDVGSWYIYYDHPALLDTLSRNADEVMSLMFNSDGSPKSVAHHQWAARFADLRSDSWWRQYVPKREPLEFQATAFVLALYGDS